MILNGISNIRYGTTTPDRVYIGGTLAWTRPTGAITFTAYADSSPATSTDLTWVVPATTTGEVTIIEKVV